MKRLTAREWRLAGLKPVPYKTGIMFNKSEGEFRHDVVTHEGYAWRGFIRFRGTKQSTYEYIPADPLMADPAWKIISRKQWLRITNADVFFRTHEA